MSDIIISTWLLCTAFNLIKIAPTLYRGWPGIRRLDYVVFTLLSLVLLAPLFAVVLIWRDYIPKSGK